MNKLLLDYGDFSFLFLKMLIKKFIQIDSIWYQCHNPFYFLSARSKTIVQLMNVVFHFILYFVGKWLIGALDFSVSVGCPWGGWLIFRYSVRFHGKETQKDHTPVFLNIPRVLLSR